MRSFAVLGLVACAAPALGGINAGWSCDGPLPSAHGPKSGDLVTGKFEVLLHSHPLNPREAHAEVLGTTVELELVAPESLDGFDGFMITPKNAIVTAGDLNGQDTECSPSGITHIPSSGKKKRYAVSVELPEIYGDVDLKVIALAREREWYESTMHIYVGEEPEAFNGMSHNTKFSLIFGVLFGLFGSTLYFSMKSWPAAYGGPRRKAHFT